MNHIQATSQRHTRATSTIDAPEIATTVPAHSDSTVRIDVLPLSQSVPVCLRWSLGYLGQNLRSSLPLLLSDIVSLLFATCMGTLAVSLAGAAAPSAFIAPGLVSIAATLGLFTLGKLYPGVGIIRRIEAYRSMLLLSLVACFAVLFVQPYPISHLATVVIGIAWLVALPAVPLARFAVRAVCGRTPWWPQPVVIIADETNEVAQGIALNLFSNRSLGLVPDMSHATATVHAQRHCAAPHVAGHINTLRIPSDVPSYRAIVVFQAESTEEMRRVIEFATHRFPHVLVVPGTGPSTIPLETNDAWTVSGELGYEVRNRLISPTAQLIKRAFDFSVAAVLLVLLSPLLAVVAVLLKWFAEGPIFYGQERIGRNGVPFQTWKFRTMFVDAEKRLYEYLSHDPELIAQWERERKLTDDPRVIPGIGHFLRRTSIDELPQLWNVVRGEMSLVGPRPLPEYHLEHFDREFRSYRQRVLPGITGLWQVNSRLEGQDENYIKWDSDYIRNWSLGLDALVLFRTFKAIYCGDGANSS